MHPQDLQDSTVVQAALPVEKRRSISRAEFQEAMHPIGRPIVLSGVMDIWPAMQRWTFSHFRTRYGRDYVEALDSLYDTRHVIPTNLGEYLEYLESPEGTRLQHLEQERGLSAPFYAYGYKPFRRHPELLKDFTWPEAIEDWSGYFSARFKYAHFPNWQGWLFFAPRGAVTKLHTDPGATILAHAQIRGRKRCLLFSPDDARFLYDGAVDPQAPDLGRFPLFAHAQPFECVLEPGTMLLLPPNWWHHITALEGAITLSYNLVNAVNFGYYVQDRHQQHLQRWLSRLPIEPRARILRKALGALKRRVLGRPWSQWFR